MPIARKKFKPEILLLERKRTSQGWFLDTDEKKYEWKTVMERMRISREGIPFSALEVIGKGLELPIKEVLILFSIPQTTYNKKRSEKALLGGNESEAVLWIIELIEFGIEVFNGETEKFFRWLKKPNPFLGGLKPESFFDSISGL